MGLFALLGVWHHDVALADIAAAVATDALRLIKQQRCGATRHHGNAQVVHYFHHYNPHFCERHRRGYETRGLSRISACGSGCVSKLPHTLTHKSNQPKGKEKSPVFSRNRTFGNCWGDSNRRLPPYYQGGSRNQNCLCRRRCQQPFTRPIRRLFHCKNAFRLSAVSAEFWPKLMLPVHRRCPLSCAASVLTEPRRRLCAAAEPNTSP